MLTISSHLQYHPFVCYALGFISTPFFGFGSNTWFSVGNDGFAFLFSHLYESTLYSRVGNLKKINIIGVSVNKKNKDDWTKFVTLAGGCAPEASTLPHVSILLVTDGRMQNFKTLEQSLLGEFRWGSFFLLPHESKVNSQHSPWGEFDKSFVCLNV